MQFTVFKQSIPYGVCLLSLVAAIWSVALPAAAQAPAVDGNLPSYTPVSGVSGNLNSVGSDTLNNLMLLWGDGFRALYPNVNIQVQGAGLCRSVFLTRGCPGKWSHYLEDK